MGAVAPGCEGLRLGRWGRSAHTWLGPGEMGHDEKPEAGAEDALINTMAWHHDRAPFHMYRHEGILLGFRVA